MRYLLIILVALACGGCEGLIGSPMAPAKVHVPPTASAEVQQRNIIWGE